MADLKRMQRHVDEARAWASLEEVTNMFVNSVLLGNAAAASVVMANSTRSDLGSMIVLGILIATVLVQIVALIWLFFH